MTTNKRGRYRVENAALEGYVVYVGYSGLPDFTQDPDGSGTTRPVAFAITPPGVGTEDLYVAMRSRNRYGVESQNQQIRIITIDNNGDEVLGTLSAPTGVSIEPAEDEAFLVAASYPGYHTDPNPGDEWRVYVKADTPPTPGVDTPAATGSIGGDFMQVVVGAYPDGDKTYYADVTVYRDADSTESAAGTAFVVLPVDPLTPTPVNTGWVGVD